MPRGGARSRSGPARTPTPIRVMKGGKDRHHNDGEPQPGAANLNPPRWMRPEAKRIWREYAPRLEKLGLLTELDVEVFAQICGLMHVCRTTPAGTADHLKALGMADRLWAQFGFSPSTRTKISTAKPKVNPLDEWLNDPNV